MKKSILFAFIFVAIISGISFGILVHLYNDANLEKATLEEVENANKLKERTENIIQATTNKTKTTPNTEVIYEVFYSQCNHIETKNEEIKREDVNQDREYFEDKYKDWQIRSFSEDKIELYKTEDKICDKHYIIKEKDGCIAIYTLDSAGNQNLKEVTDIQVQYLPEEDINLLKKGIGVIGDVELAKRIEDYE